ncbi:hypothetical protein NPIL_80111 [Nephila pilipes]|uniref:Uncharacterized protein n=1 Tax=Nephila pilipes TaxID=299642 RepID=A0A8X6Q0N2_NEPPI|nr:hypothetical protein NPIL_80111 [Nephila pilipes]
MIPSLIKCVLSMRQRSDSYPHHVFNRETRLRTLCRPHPRTFSRGSRICNAHGSEKQQRCHRASRSWSCRQITPGASSRLSR